MITEKTIRVEITSDDVVEKFANDNNSNQAKMLGDIYRELHASCGSTDAYKYQIQSIAEELDDDSKQLIKDLFWNFYTHAGVAYKQ
jgi:flavin-dependent dehydrogenase